MYFDYRIRTRDKLSEDGEPDLMEMLADSLPCFDNAISIVMLLFYAFYSVLYYVFNVYAYIFSVKCLLRLHCIYTGTPRKEADSAPSQTG